MDLLQAKCVPCRGGVDRLDEAAVVEALRLVPGWAAEAGATRLARRFKFRDFVEAMRFVNAMAEVAEGEGHHPDFAVHWNQVDVTLWTHVAGGVTMNDFILAAKLDARAEARGPAH